MIGREDWEEYLVRLYFGNRDDLLYACIRRAYRDFNRTGHGLSGLENKGTLYKEASEYLRQTFLDIEKDKASVSNQEAFDQWHQGICIRLAGYYITYGYNTFSVGQAQKWINMTFKYIFTMGEDRLPGFGDLYKRCHVPIDNIVLDNLRKEAMFPGLNCAWSRLNDYGEYLSCQKWIREKFPSEDPLDVEFRMWMRGTGSNGPYQLKMQQGATIHHNRSCDRLNQDMKPTQGMPYKEDIFKGRVTDLFLYDVKGWRRRDIWFYKRDLISNRKYTYPSRGDKIVLIDPEKHRYELNFSKPDYDHKICLGTPGRLKTWYQRKGFDEQRIVPDTWIFFQYTGIGNEFRFFTESEETSLKREGMSIP